MIAEAPYQFDLLNETVVQQFERWRQSPGGKRVLQMAYAITAHYARRFDRTGRRVSMKLIWEELRDNICFMRKRIPVDASEGFALNNNFHAHVARHILKHRPEWDGLFELRELHTK